MANQRISKSILEKTKESTIEAYNLQESQMLKGEEMAPPQMEDYPDRPSLLSSFYPREEERDSALSLLRESAAFADDVHHGGIQVID